MGKHRGRWWNEGGEKDAKLESMPIGVSGGYLEESEREERSDSGAAPWVRGPRPRSATSAARWVRGRDRGWYRCSR